MPESVTDRPTKAHEYLFLLSKSAKYFCDMKAIQEPACDSRGCLRFKESRALAMGRGWTVFRPFLRFGIWPWLPVVRGLGDNGFVVGRHHHFMFAEQYSVEGRPSLHDSEFLYIQKTIHFFEQLVQEEAADQRIPLEILRVLKPCRVCIIMSADAFFCIAAYYGADDPRTQVVYTEDRRPKSLDVNEAERIGIKLIIRGVAADPLTLRFPIRSLDTYADDKRSLLTPLVQSYLTFEVSWAKQRGLLTVPKPFFPGQHFKIDRDFIFVLMPFAPDFNEIYSVCIKPTLERRVPRCLRADEIFHNKPIVEVIWRNINEAGLIVADLTSRNPNVFYEVGMAHTLGKEVVLLTQDLDDVPFDLRHLNIIRYRWTPPGAEKLKAALDATVTSILRRDRPQVG